MNRLLKLIFIIYLLAMGIILIAYDGPDQQAEKISEFGHYQGYSEAKYEEFKRSSVYIPARDKTRLAIDIYRPSIDGQPVEKALPAVLSFTRYWRAYELEDGRIRTILGMLASGEPVAKVKSEPKWPPRELLRHGYVVISADARGTGASFGKGVGTEARDAHDIIEWVAKQPWCDGNIGMVGRSYLGTVQLLAASSHPPSLKAIFPGVPSFFDGHRILFGGGIMRKGGVVTMRNTLAALADAQDSDAKDFRKAFGGIKNVPPVDEDPDGRLRDEARAGHGEGSFEMYLALFRADPNARAVIKQLKLESEGEIIDALLDSDGLEATLKAHPEVEAQLLAVQFYRRSYAMTARMPSGDEKDIDGTGAIMSILERISKSGIPAYYWDGWQDPLPHDRMLFYANIDTPKRITFGPWTHGPNEPNDPREKASAELEAIEQVRWFDYWLKGIKNGIVDEPPVVYSLMDTSDAWDWRDASSFPPPEAKDLDFYFGGGPMDTVNSANDGSLSRVTPPEKGSDKYTVDYTATSGTKTRLHDTTGGGPCFYPDMTANDRKGLTYTSEILEKDVLVAGYPIAILYVSADVAHHEFTVYLEEVEANGYSRYLTQSSLHSSHRTLGTPKYSNLSLPWTTSVKEDVAATAPLNKGVAELKIVLEPVGNRFNAGHRIRITVTGADADLNWSVPRKPPAKLTVERNSKYPSRIVLPILDQ
jgi:putative CocE/NonD family hydrolase